MPPDPSSRILGREAFLQELARHATPEAEGEQTFGLILTKLSHLRDINQAFGFTTGDACLESIAARLGRIARPKDLVGRLGGGMFALLLNDPCDEALLELAVNRLLDVLAAPVDVGTRTLTIACRAAGGLYRDHGPTPDALLGAVEDGLHQTFRKGKPYLLLKPRHEAPATDDFTLLREVEAAIDNGELTLHYQPQLDLREHRVAGFEALLRWHHPVFGQVSPERVIPLAEKNEVIVPLTRWTINTALREFKELRGLPDQVKVSLNLSAPLLTDRSILDLISDALAIWDVDPARLMVEITETSMMSNPEASVAAVHSLRELGVRISIDDFGTGYSSLAYFKNIPATELKIDRSFVSRMLDNPGDRRIVQTVIDLAHNFGLKVVAEGIENAETQAALVAMGCDIAQGYHYSKPLSHDDLCAWLTRRHAAPARPLPVGAEA